MRAARGRGTSPSLLFYGVAAADDDAGTALPASTTRLVFRDISAIVESARPDAGDVDIARYLQVVSFLFDRVPVLPARPGTIFQSRELLAQWLELHYFTLAEALTFVTDRAVARVELAYVDAASPEAMEPPTVLEAMAAEVMRVLRRHSAAYLSIPNPSNNASDGSDASGAGSSRHAFLVERDKWDVFAEAVRQEDDRHAALGLEMTGPWPAYDFVRMDFGG